MTTRREPSESMYDVQPSPDGYAELDFGSGGVSLRGAGTMRLYARITSVSASTPYEGYYAWVEVTWDGTQWVDAKSGRSGTTGTMPAVERNLLDSVPVGAVVLAEYAPNGEKINFQAPTGITGFGTGLRHARFKVPAGGGASVRIEDALVVDGPSENYVSMLSRVQFWTGAFLLGTVPLPDGLVDLSASGNPTVLLLESENGPLGGADFEINGFTEHGGLHGSVLIAVNVRQSYAGSSDLITLVHDSPGVYPDSLYNFSTTGFGGTPSDLQLFPGQCAVYVYLNHSGYNYHGWHLVATTGVPVSGAGSGSGLNVPSAVRPVVWEMYL